MGTIYGCLNFNCFSPKMNLIFISIANIIGIVVNSFKSHEEEYKIRINSEFPILGTINLIIQSLSLVSSIIVFFIKKCMDQRAINKAITSISTILNKGIILLSFINIFVIVKDFINFENNDFLNSSIKYGENITDYYTNVNRLNELKEIKYAPLEYSESLQTMIITDENKFSFVNGSHHFIDYKKNTFLDTLTNAFVGQPLFIFLLEELLNMLCALNWGSVGNKIGKLIDDKIESRLEDYGDEKDCIAKFILTMRGKKFLVFSIIIFVIDLAYMVLGGLLKMEWIFSHIVEYTVYFDWLNVFFF